MLQNSRNQGFLTIFSWWWKDTDTDPYLRLKDSDPDPYLRLKDSDPQRWLLHVYVGNRILYSRKDKIFRKFKDKKYFLNKVAGWHRYRYRYSTGTGYANSNGALIMHEKHTIQIIFWFCIKREKCFMHALYKMAASTNDTSLSPLCSRKYQLNKTQLLVTCVEATPGPSCFL